MTSGSVKIGGVDVRNYDLDVLRREVSMVLQKNVLFSGTIIDNMHWGDEHASLEEYVEKTFFSCLKRAAKEICYVECEFAFEK